MTAQPNLNHQMWLPSSEESRRIVNAIASGEDLMTQGHLSDLPDYCHDKIMEIEKAYGEITASLQQNYTPRNYPFYLLIRENYPSFNLIETEHQTHIETYYAGEKRSLLSYLLGLIPQDEIAESCRISRLSNLVSNQDLLSKCLSILEQEGACKLSDENIQRFSDWIAMGQAGLPMTIISPVCPDYSFIKGENRTYRFTFETLNGGAGLSGLRLYESLAVLHDLFRNKVGIRSLKHHVCVGDFEAFSSENTSRLGLTKHEFVSLNKRSAETLANSAPAPVTTSLFTDHCGGERGWECAYADMEKRFQAHEFGDLENSTFVKDIAEARRPLYERWYPNSGMTQSDLAKRVVEQGLEYATMGHIISTTFENPLVLGADHNRMAPFYQLTGAFPVIYLDRNYE